MPSTRANVTASFGSIPSANNPVINGAFDIWQRGTSFANSASALAYTADRWYQARNATGMTISRQVTNDTTNLPFIQYCSRVARDSGNTSTEVIRIVQSLETVNSIPFLGKTVTLSFYARKGADLIYVNDVSNGKVFGAETTSGAIITKEGIVIQVDEVTKEILADTLLDQIKERVSHG
ncbi:MAG: hypothetical protein EBX97_07940 [Actinobacteria bacterium]|nr:hypothetical protein [Actinomycetota bacterium]